MSRPSAPPPELRPTLTDAERDSIESMVGPAEDALLRPLRDARGRQFQRLEFIGDSVLDVVMAVHEVVEPGCPACGARGSPQRFVTDARLARCAAEAGLGQWLEWEAGDERLADLVEACAAVAYFAGGWGRVGEYVSRVVHPVTARTTRVLESGEEGSPDRALNRETRRIGSSLLELAAGRAVYAHDPEADEGALSRRRARVHRVDRVAAYARRTGVVDRQGPDPLVSDRVERRLADRLLRLGAASALEDATQVVLRG